MFQRRPRRPAEVLVPPHSSPIKGIRSAVDAMTSQTASPTETTSSARNRAVLNAARRMSGLGLLSSASAESAANVDRIVRRKGAAQGIEVPAAGRGGQDHQVACLATPPQQRRCSGQGSDQRLPPEEVTVASYPLGTQPIPPSRGFG